MIDRVERRSYGYYENVGTRAVGIKSTSGSVQIHAIHVNLTVVL